MTTLNATAAQNFFAAAQTPQKARPKTQQQKADEAIEREYNPDAPKAERTPRAKAEKVERVLTGDEPHNPVTGIIYGAKTAELLEAQGFTDNRWVTQKQANELGGMAFCPIVGQSRTKNEKNSGVRKQSGVKRSEMNNGVTVSARIPSHNKNSDGPQSFRVTFTLYNIQQCWGVLKRDGGTLD